eukprot:1879945-Rhodomonas_salina.1
MAVSQLAMNGVTLFCLADYAFSADPVAFACTLLAPMVWHLQVLSADLHSKVSPPRRLAQHGLALLRPFWFAVAMMLRACCAVCCAVLCCAVLCCAVWGVSCSVGPQRRLSALFRERSSCAVKCAVECASHLRTAARRGESRPRCAWRCEVPGMQRSRQCRAGVCVEVVTSGEWCVYPTREVSRDGHVCCRRRVSGVCSLESAVSSLVWYLLRSSRAEFACVCLAQALTPDEKMLCVVVTALFWLRVPWE